MKDASYEYILQFSDFSLNGCYTSVYVVYSFSINYISLLTNSASLAVAVGPIIRRLNGPISLIIHGIQMYIKIHERRGLYDINYLIKMKNREAVKMRTYLLCCFPENE